MKLHKIILCIVLIAIFSCNKNKHIELKKMSQIVADMHLSDAYAATIYANDTAVIKNSFSKNLDTLKVYYATIFKKYQISETEFMASFNYYKSDPDLYDSLYYYIDRSLSDLRPKEMH